MRHAVAAVTVVGVLSTCAAPDRTPPDSALQRVDSAIGAWVADGRVPGAVLHVSRPGREPFVRAYGWAQTHEYGTGQYRAPEGDADSAGVAELAEPMPMTPETVFDLASVTKVVGTTMAIMLLVDRGLVDLDAPVHDYVPEFVDGGKERITPRHLLTHRSGLAQWQPLYYRASTPADAYARIRALPLQWAVGEERHYSDLGFMILGLLVEEVTGAPLDVFLHDELYGPLGLTATGFRPMQGEREIGGRGSALYAATSHGNPYEHRMVHDPDFGYRIDIDANSWDGWRRRTLSGEVNDGNAYHAFGGVAGHAGLFSTAAELDTLLRLLLDGGALGGRRYVGEDVIDRFLASTGDGQALGWQIPANVPSTAFAHNGFTGTFVLGDRATGLALVLLTNRQNAGVDARTSYPDVGPLQRTVTEALLGGAPG